jgi:CPA1 family monovalent cation:H+ antiporter
VGWFSLRLRRWAHDPRVEITLSLITPYIAFLLPQQLGGSGVLATVATGLYVSWNGPLLIPAATRLQGIFFWDLVVYFLEGFVFLVTGIETRVLLDRAAAVEIRELAFAIVLTVAVVVVARFVWVFPATYLPRWLSASLRRRDPQPPWQLVFILAFTGVRGVVSLAAALAIPLTTAIGTPFPDRNLILLVTFGVIIVTLIGNGLLLPSVIRVLGLSKEAVSEREREQKAERAARSAALKVARERLEGIASDRQIAPDILSSLRTRHDYRVTRLPGESAEGRDLTATEADVMAELIAVEREHIYRLLQDGQITDEARRRIERDLDLEEASIATFRKSEPDPPL